MDNLIDMIDHTDYQKLAIEKIEKELKEFKGDRYGEVVKTYVANTLRTFCEKNESFAKVLYKTRRSLSDCIKAAMKGCGKAISDIEVYRRVAKFYFPDSEVEFKMTVTVGDAPDESYILKEAPKPKEKAEKAEKEKAPSAKDKPKEKTDDNVIQISLFD